MNQNTQQDDSLIAKVKGTAAVVIWLICLLSVPVELICHWNVGKRYLGLSAAFAVPVMLFFGIFGGHSPIWPLFLFFLLYLARCFVHRIVYLYRWFRGIQEIEHTMRPGVPLVMHLRPKWDVVKVYWFEPVGVFVVGFILSIVTLPLGFYLMAAGVAWLCSLVLRMKYAERMTDDSRDAALEARFNAERMREMQRQ